MWVKDVFFLIKNERSPIGSAFRCMFVVAFDLLQTLGVAVNSPIQVN